MDEWHQIRQMIGMEVRQHDLRDIVLPESQLDQAMRDSAPEIEHQPRVRQLDQDGRGRPRQLQPAGACSEEDESRCHSGESTMGPGTETQV